MSTLAAFWLTWIWNPWSQMQNLRRPLLLSELLQQKRLAKNTMISYIKKAGFTVCLFFLFTSSYAIDPVWKFDVELEKAYQLVLNLQIEQAYTKIAQLKGK